MAFGTFYDLTFSSPIDLRTPNGSFIGVRFLPIQATYSAKQTAFDHIHHLEGVLWMPLDSECAIFSDVVIVIKTYQEKNRQARTPHTTALKMHTCPFIAAVDIKYGFLSQLL